MKDIKNDENLYKIINDISKKYNANIFIYNGGITYGNLYRLVSEIKKANNEKTDNCILLLTTSGGDIDAAYKIVRYIKKVYKKFYLFIFGYCKSAGTLIALGADEIIMSDLGEFGPLDVQIYQSDELSYTSGLNLMQSIEYLDQKTFEKFWKAFSIIKSGLSGINAKTVGKLSKELSLEFFIPIIKQIDPLRIGEYQRALDIAIEYGNRICSDKEAVNKLVMGYVSHGFVIDIDEATDIFKNVKRLDKEELELEELFAEILREPIRDKEKSIISFLNKNKEEKKNGKKRISKEINKNK